jgi:hypothetical protein
MAKKAAPLAEREEEVRGPARPAQGTKTRRPDPAARLRPKAKLAGILIQARRGPAGSEERRYALVDSATREVLASGIRDVDALGIELWRRIRERAVVALPAEREGSSASVCSNCGRRRTGAFRYCRGCGLDFEPAPVAMFDPVRSASRPVFVLDERTGPETDRRPEPTMSRRPADEQGVAADLAPTVGEWLIDVLSRVDSRWKILFVVVFGVLIGVAVTALMNTVRI